MRVLIIGGGLGGLCLAQGLVKASVEVTVFERDRTRDERLDRYRLHVSPAGSRALRACLPDSAWQAFLLGVGEVEGGFGFLTEQLRTLVVVDDDVMYPPSADPAQRAYPADRTFLRETLLSGLNRTVEFGRKFERYAQRADGAVTAYFADGSSAVGDVLVGADGAGSVVRRQYRPGTDPVPTGALGIGWTVPLDGAAGPPVPGRLQAGMNMIMAAVPFFLFTSVFRRPEHAGEGGSEARAQQGDYLLCALVARREACPPGIEALSGPELRAAATTMMAGWHRDLTGLVAGADPATFGAYPFTAAPPASDWAPSTVTLLGDAVHAMPPAGGNGANMAFRDASLLHRNLADAAHGKTPLLDAVGGYEREMRGYAFSAIRSAMTNERLGLNASPIAQAGMRAWFRLCDAFPAAKRAGFGENWAKDARPRPWELQPAGA
jgi:2-polyprenyl-6-methoxyphenol hydroxylase-like FAD-dependent oxidoreductase